MAGDRGRGAVKLGPWLGLVALTVESLNGVRNRSVSAGGVRVEDDKAKGSTGVQNSGYQERG